MPNLHIDPLSILLNHLQYHDAIDNSHFRLDDKATYGVTHEIPYNKARTQAVAQQSISALRLSIDKNVVKHEVQEVQMDLRIDYPP